MGDFKKEVDGNITTYEDSNTRIIINTKWCKGCEFCVIYCPKKVLSMERGKAIVVNLTVCTRCMLCELRCPDFAIEVHKVETKENV